MSVEKTMDDKIDELELSMQEYEPVNCPLQHIFTPGLYTRTIFMPTGTLITSLIHRTEHQFIVSSGVALVKVNEAEWKRVEAPYLGKTMPGTRRILYIESDCMWTTVHATTIQPENDSEEAITEAVSKIEDEIIEPHVNALIGGIVKNNIITQQIDNQ